MSYTVLFLLITLGEEVREGGNVLNPIIQDGQTPEKSLKINWTEKKINK